MIKTLLSYEFNRLKNKLSPSIEYQQFCNRLYAFAEATAKIESDDNLKAKNPTTSAKGLYQFTDGSLETAYNRVENYAIRNKVTLKVTDNIRNRLPVLSLDRHEQMFLFFANLFKQRGTDAYLVNICNNTNATKNQHRLYSKFHHTNVDTATIKRMFKYYGALGG